LDSEKAKRVATYEDKDNTETSADTPPHQPHESEQPLAIAQRPLYNKPCKHMQLAIIGHDIQLSCSTIGYLQQYAYSQPELYASKQAYTTWTSTIIGYTKWPYPHKVVSSTNQKDWIQLLNFKDCPIEQQLTS
jgi:hypothetical protein